MVELHLGDCLKVLSRLPDGAVDAVCTDPPYALNFMGQRWDSFGGVVSQNNGYKPRDSNGYMKGRGKAIAESKKSLPAFAAFSHQWASAVLRVLRPGGYMLCFGGTRTYHRLACAVEDAGFEIRDCIMWLYGSGFPKGKGCLKPSYEPVLVCRRPGPKVLPLGIDECRIACGTEHMRGTVKSRNTGVLSESKGMYTPGRSFVATDSPLGRWPANVVHDGSPEVMEAFARFGTKHVGSGQIKISSGKKSGNGSWTSAGGMHKNGSENIGIRTFGDTGTAARFFMACPQDESSLFDCAKATMGVWQSENASTVGESFSQRKQHAVSVLRDVATWVSHGAIRLSDCQVHSTVATQNELNSLCESVIALILSSVNGHWQGLLHTKHIQSRSLASAAAVLALTGTTTTTINPFKSAGSAVTVTLSDTPNNTEAGAADSPSNLRFRYCAKASRRERNAGLEGLPLRDLQHYGDDITPRRNGASSGGALTNGTGKVSRQCNHHPTVKPLALMTWLVRLVCPEGGTVLDPFLGSGTTALACIKTGRKCIGIELDKDYMKIAQRRIAEAERKEKESLFQTA